MQNSPFHPLIRCKAKATTRPDRLIPAWHVTKTLWPWSCRSFTCWAAFTATDLSFSEGFSVSLKGARTVSTPGKVSDSKGIPLAHRNKAVNPSSSTLSGLGGAAPCHSLGIISLASFSIGKKMWGAEGIRAVTCHSPRTHFPGVPGGLALPPEVNFQPQYV